MSNSDANQRCMICRAIGFVIAAIVVGLITWWLFGKVAAWLAIIAFLGLFAFGLWLVLKYCGQPDGHASGIATTAAAGAVGAAAVSGASSAQADATAKAEAAAKAEADAAAAKTARADADAQAAKIKADTEAAAKAKADAAATAAKADADAQAEAARVKAELDAAKAKAEADRAAKAQSKEKSVAASVAGVGSAAAAGASSPGTRPAALDGARGGNADDLKKIKGVGPKMEKMCNGLGFYHFDQIAAWTADEVSWVDQNLEGFKGRVTRDNWVEQAKLLATGGETAFSQKVDKGDVY